MPKTTPAFCKENCKTENAILRTGVKMQIVTSQVVYKKWNGISLILHSILTPGGAFLIFGPNYSAQDLPVESSWLPSGLIKS